MTDQSFIITSTYDPSNDTITCEPGEVKVCHGKTGKITVRIQLENGQPGSISFPLSPINWTSPEPPPFPITEIVITAPNLHEHGGEKFPFEINYVYTPPGGDPVTKTGDPTIILEGTGGPTYNYPES